MIRLKSVHFDLTIPLFGQQVILILGYPESRLAEILDKYKPSPHLRKDALADDERQLAGVMVQDYRSGQYLVYMPDLPDGYAEDGTLTHELFHVVEYVAHNLGIKYRLGVSSEIYTYLLGWLKAEVNRKLWKAINY